MYTINTAKSPTFNLHFRITSDLHAKCMDTTMDILEKCLGSATCQCTSLEHGTHNTATNVHNKKNKHYEKQQEHTVLCYCLACTSSNTDFKC